MQLNLYGSESGGEKALYQHREFLPETDFRYEYSSKRSGAMETS